MRLDNMHEVVIVRHASIHLRNLILGTIMNFALKLACLVHCLFF